VAVNLGEGCLLVVLFRRCGDPAAGTTVTLKVVAGKWATASYYGEPELPGFT
jgi:hypothetical protein